MNTNKMFTKCDVVELVNSGQVNMKVLASRRLSRRQVIVEVQNRDGVDVVTAPRGYARNDVVGLLLHSFTLPDYAIKVGITEKRRRNDSVNEFFSFIENKSSGVTDRQTVPTQLIYDWRQHLVAAKAAISAWVVLNTLKKIITRAATHCYGAISKWPESVRDTWLAIRKNTPTKPNHKKIRPIGMHLGIPPNEFLDDVLLMGLRYGAIWLLQKLNSQRDAIVNDQTVSEILIRNQGKTLKDFDSSFFSSTHRDGRVYSPDRDALMLAVLRSIQNDDLATEWQCYSFGKLQQLLSLEDELLRTGHKAELLARHISDESQLRSCPKWYGCTDAAWEPLRKWFDTTDRACRMPKPNWWGSNLIVHTALERLLMVWLLATERAQQSGIKKLTLDAIDFSGDPPKSLQISTIKLRRDANAHAKRRAADISTQVYKKNTPVFGVYLNWWKLEDSARRYLTNYNCNKRFINPCSSQVVGLIPCARHHVTTSAFLPLELLMTSGTVWSETFLRESDYSQEAQAFIAIIRRLLNKRQGDYKIHVALPSSHIGQSLVMKKELGNNSDGSWADVESEAMGQTSATGRNVYKDEFYRAGVKDLVEPIQAFARQVGDDKIRLAHKLASEMYTRTRKIGLSELEQLCGLETATKRQKDLIEILDEQDKVTIAGEINLKGELLVVESDFTAALMHGYIKHLEDGISGIVETSRYETTLRHLAKYLHLNQVFHRLDPHVQQEGKRIAARTQFPFPPLN